MTQINPTTDVGEEEVRTTPLHVGKGGRLSIAPENQLKMFEKNGASATA